MHSDLGCLDAMRTALGFFKIIIIMHISAFAIGMRKARLNFYGGDAGKMRMTEIIRDNRMRTTMDYSRGISEGRITFCEARACQLEIKPEEAIS